MVPAERSVTVAIGHGKKASRHIDARLRGRTYDPPPKHELATFDTLNTWYYSDALRTYRPRLEEVRRQTTFEEVVEGLDESNALCRRACRCMSCGNCFSCDNQRRGLPGQRGAQARQARRALRDPPRLLQGLRVVRGRECPCGALEMVLEEI